MLMVVLSYRSDYQILSTLLVLLVFTIYSFIYCPYRPLLRIFFHLSDVAFIIQIVLLYLMIKINYGEYDLNIING